MGSVTVSTTDTEIYYPSDWLIEGGPTFESMSCPKVDDQIDEDVEPLQVIYNPRTRYFGVTHNGFIVMESKNPEDLADYVREYTQEFKSWVTEQDRINAEADRDAE